MTRRGFTLIEVILAASLGAVLALATAQVLWVTRRAGTSVRRRAETRGLGLALERRLRADLLALVPPGGLHASGLVGESAERAGSGERLLAGPYLDLGLGEEEPPVEGRDRLTLAVFAPPPAFGHQLAPGEGALLQVVYSVDDDAGTAERGLVRDVTRVRDPLPGSEAPPPDLLAEEVVGLDVRYFDGQTWQETWDSGASDTLPQLVRVRLAVLRPGQELACEEVWVSPPTSRAGAVPEPTQ
jgi:prepilin-type N-terminal cleavage/methylation domain-containing protein